MHIKTTHSEHSFQTNTYPGQSLRRRKTKALQLVYLTLFSVKIVPQPNLMHKNYSDVSKRWVSAILVKIELPVVYNLSSA